MLGYDYSQNNLYFVTICVQDRECCFGAIAGTGRDLSVHNQNSAHYKIPADNQNPVHNGNCSDNAITKIMQRNQYGTIAYDRLEWLENRYKYVLLHSYIVMPNHVHAIIEIDSDRISEQSIKIKSLSELVGAYKTTSSKQIHLAGLSGFAWQRSFHDHIIRNDVSYERISNYIETNQERWNTDVFFEN
jgi:REP element-mobilizing transposase RayT